METPVTTFGYETEAGEKFPRYIMYDVNNVCNARCPFCPQSDIARSDAFDPQHIAWEVFEKTIHETAQYPVELVRFTGDGEPLLHPRMMDMIALAKDLGVANVNLTTNGSLLKGKRLEALLATPPDVIDFSLDAMTADTYAKYRVGLDFKTTMDNVHHFLTRRDANKTRVIVSMIAHPGLEDEVKEFEAYWTPRVDQVAIRTLHANLGAVDVEQPPLPDPRWPCPHLWQRLVIDFRGHIRFCPVDWFDQTCIGDAGQDTLHDIWHGETMSRLRQRHLDSDYSGCGVCEKCTDWANTPWKHSWLDLINKKAH